MIIFDEIQKFPKAREAIKYLVADGRYDYIATGSLISIKENVEDIEFLDEFFDLYYQYATDAYVTLEVYENDYSDSQIYLSTKKLVERYKK